MTESNERTNTRTNEHTNGRTDKRQGENYIPRGINAGGIKNYIPRGINAGGIMKGFWWLHNCQTVVRHEF